MKRSRETRLSRPTVREVTKHFTLVKQMTAHQIADLLDQPLRTIKRYQAKVRRGESLEDTKRSGRPPKNTDSLRRSIALQHSRHPERGVRQLTVSYNQTHNSTVSEETVRKALHDLDYTYRSPPVGKLTSAHKLARVAFASAHLRECWTNKWAFDEAYFQLDRAKRKVWVKRDHEPEGRPRGQKRSTEKISVGIACAICRGRKSALAFLPKNWRAATLVEVFDSEIYPSLRWRNTRAQKNQLIRDNDGRHQAKVWRDYEEQRQLRPLLPWPGLSPDFNPIENCFSWMKDYVEKRLPSTARELRQAVCDAWRELPVEMTVHLFDSMSKRMHEALDRDGGRTHY